MTNCSLRISYITGYREHLRPAAASALRLRGGGRQLHPPTAAAARAAPLPRSRARLAFERVPVSARLALLRSCLLRRRPRMKGRLVFSCVADASFGERYWLEPWADFLMVVLLLTGRAPAPQYPAHAPRPTRPADRATDRAGGWPARRCPIDRRTLSNGEWPPTAGAQLQLSFGRGRPSDSAGGHGTAGRRRRRRPGQPAAVDTERAATQRTAGDRTPRRPRAVLRNN